MPRRKGSAGVSVDLHAAGDRMNVRWWARFATEVGLITGAPEEVLDLQRTPDVEREVQEGDGYRRHVDVSAEEAREIVARWRRGR